MKFRTLDRTYNLPFEEVLHLLEKLVGHVERASVNVFSQLCNCYVEVSAIGDSFRRIP